MTRPANWKTSTPNYLKKQMWQRQSEQRDLHDWQKQELLLADQVENRVRHTHLSQHKDSVDLGLVERR